MQHDNWQCPKCAHTDFNAGEIRVAGGFWSKVFDVQASKYSAVICERCGYTELYRAKSSTLGTVFDLFTR